METLHSLHTIDTPVGTTGCTVRRGRKWFDNNLSGGIELCQCRKAIDHKGNEIQFHTVVGHARVFGRQYLPFSVITDKMIEDEHEESSRNKEGLFESMQRAYGPEFTKDDYVTLVTYWRTD